MHHRFFNLSLLVNIIPWSLNRVTMNKKNPLYLLSMFSIVFQTSSFGISNDGSEPLKRKTRVLVLPLENTTGSKSHEWMQTALADNLKTQLLRTKKFEVMDVRTASSILPDAVFIGISKESAAALAKKLNCEVVTQGRFMAVGQKFRLEMEATDPNGQSTLSAPKADGSLDSSMFGTIDVVVETLSNDLVKLVDSDKIPNQKRDMAMEIRINNNEHPEQTLPNHQSDKKPEPNVPPHKATTSKHYEIHAALGGHPPIGEISDHIQPRMGLRMGIRRQSRIRFIYPAITAEVSYAKGKDVTGMLFYFTGLGFTYPVELIENIRMFPLISLGLSGGRLYYETGSNFNTMALDISISFERPFTDFLRVYSSIGYQHIFDKFVPGQFVTLYIGVGASF